MHASSLLLLLALVVPSLQSAPPAETYDPSPDFPFGRRNPEAPVELERFTPMMGEFEVSPGTAENDGAQDSGRLRVAYAFDGWGVEVCQWSESGADSITLVFDKSKSKWWGNRITAPEMVTTIEQWETDPPIRDKDGIALWSGSPDRLEGKRLSWFKGANDGCLIQSVEEWGDGIPLTARRFSCQRTPDPARLLSREPGTATELPFGKRNPLAPSELGRLDFLIGEFTVATEVTGGGGYAIVPNGKWVGQYFLDGWGIRLEGSSGEGREREPGDFTGFFVFTPSSKAFSYTQIDPRVGGMSVWEGTFDEEDIVFRLCAKPDAIPIRLAAITDRGFEYRMEGEVVGSSRYTRVR